MSWEINEATGTLRVLLKDVEDAKKAVIATTEYKAYVAAESKLREYYETYKTQAITLFETYDTLMKQANDRLTAAKNDVEKSQAQAAIASLTKSLADLTATCSPLTVRATSVNILSGNRVSEILKLYSLAELYEMGAIQVDLKTLDKGDKPWQHLVAKKRSLALPDKWAL